MRDYPQHFLILWFVGAVLFVLTLLGGGVLLFWGDLSPTEQALIRPLLAPRAGLLVVLCLTGTVLLGLCGKWVSTHFIQAPLRLLEAARLAQHENHPTPPATPLLSPPEHSVIGAVDAFIVQLLAERVHLQQARDAEIAQARQATENERNRLAALMSELTQGVIVCNTEGRILLYNRQARVLFQTFTQQALIGLGRSIYGVLDERLIAHARSNLQSRLDRGVPHPLAQFVTSDANGQLLRVQMAPVRALETGPTPQPRRSGFVLMLENLSTAWESLHEQEIEIQHLTETARQALATLSTTVRSVFPGQTEREPLQVPNKTLVDAHFQALHQCLNHIQTQLTQSQKNRWPLEAMPGIDLITAAQSRIATQTGRPVKCETMEETLWIRADSFSLLQILVYLSARLVEEFEVREIRLALTADEQYAAIDLIWQGQAMSTETIMGWEMEPMQLIGAASPLSVRDVIARHRGAIGLERDKTRHRAWLRIRLPRINPEHSLMNLPDATDERPEFYDFDLFSPQTQNQTLADIPLSTLTYTVFDTETSGLNPSEGDEIIQIGAIRIVNQKRLNHETFDQLLDPGFPLSEANTRIHGITNAMLAGQPKIAQVLPAFHAFCADTILVAHNAAFDMRFLQMKESETGIAFRQPVLDTLLLSAVIHPHQESHKLEAIAARLNISLNERHTALGDARATAEIFLKFIPLLAAQGITTLGQAQAAAEKTYYARLAY